MNWYLENLLTQFVFMQRACWQAFVAIKQLLSTALKLQIKELGSTHTFSPAPSLVKPLKAKEEHFF